MTKARHWSAQWLGFAGVVVLLICIHSAARAKEYAEPIVATEQLKLQEGDQVVDTIARGDLLTVLEELDDVYVIITRRGKRGVVSKALTAPLKEAVGIYDQLIEKDSENGQLYILRANAWWERGEMGKALDDFNRAIAFGYTNADGYSSRGMCHAATERYDEAIWDYTKAIELDPEYEAAYINRAGVYVTQRKYEEALKDYSEAIGLNENRASTFQQRAIVWKQLGMFDKAIEDFDKTVTLNPESASALLSRGFLRFEMGESERAIADFSASIKIDPRQSIAYNNRGYNYRLLGQWKKALNDFGKAVALNPDYALAYQNKAWLLAAADDDTIRNGAQAVVAATKACELTSYKRVDDLKALAAAFAEAGDFEKAVGWQEKVVELAETDNEDFEKTMAERYRSEKPFRLSLLEEEPDISPRKRAN